MQRLSSGITLFLSVLAPLAGAGNTWYRPAPDTSWELQLQGTINTSYDARLYDIDLFDTPQETIDALHAQGRKVICYFSAGSYEEWRDDAADFPPSALGNTLDGWPGEWWLDVRDPQLQPIMSARLDLAQSRGCDGVDPDNVDGYTNDTGFPLTAEDQLAYNLFLATAAHARGLAIGLKNDLDQIETLVGNFDFALNEQCHQYNECDMLSPFVQAGKPVFNVEYASRYDDPAVMDALCLDSQSLGIQTLHLPLMLDGSFRTACPQQPNSAITPILNFLLE